MDQYLPYLLDTRSIHLWKKLSTKYQICIAESFEPNYMINIRRSFFGKRIITIYINTYDLSPAAFTHELLHLYIKDQKNLVADEFERLLFKNSDINYFFSTNLINHIINSLEHIRMLPIFLDLGFNNEDFLSDYHDPKMDDFRLSEIKKKYFNNVFYDKEAVDMFIGNFFGMKACNNPTIDYSKYYAELNSLDNELFVLLTKFYLDWKNLDHEKNYKSILNEFIVDIKVWKENKKII